MCRTVHAILSSVICGIQMLVRVFMTVILMIENVIRMLLQTLYNFISFLLQMISLIPICVVFLVTARLKCFICGGGGPCPVGARGGTCDCIMSFIAVLIIFLIFRATGVLDKVFYALGYTKAEAPTFMKFVPTMGEITECSRNDTTTGPATTMGMEEWIEKYGYLFNRTKATKEVPTRLVAAKDDYTDTIYVLLTEAIGDTQSTETNLTLTFSTQTTDTATTAG